MLARSIYALIVAALGVLAPATRSNPAESPCVSVLDHKFVNLQDKQVALCRVQSSVGQFNGRI